MEMGTWADWVSAIGGLLAVIAAVISWKVSDRALQVQQDQNEREKEEQRLDMVRRRREQASHVVAFGAKLPERGDDEVWSLFLYNGSERPVFDVVVESQHLKGGAKNYKLELGILPPGTYVVPSHPKYHWGSLINLDHTDERVEYLVKGEGMKMVTSISFVDAEGTHWIKEGRELRELPAGE